MNQLCDEGVHKGSWVHTKERRFVSRNLFLRDALQPQPGASTSVSPSGPLSSARRDVVVLALEEIEELVTFELGVGADILLIGDLILSIQIVKRATYTVFYQPRAHFRLRPARPKCVAGSRPIILNELLHLFALDLSITLDDLVVDQVLTEVRVRPMRPDVVVGVVVVFLHLSQHLFTWSGRRRDDVVGDEPLTDVTVGPRLPYRVRGAEVVLLHLIDELVTLCLLLGLDDTVLLEPFAHLVVIPGA